MLPAILAACSTLACAVQAVQCTSSDWFQCCMQEMKVPTMPHSATRMLVHNMSHPLHLLSCRACQQQHGNVASAGAARVVSTYAAAKRHHTHSISIGRAGSWLACQHASTKKHGLQLLYQQQMHSDGWMVATTAAPQQWLGGAHDAY